MCVFVCVFLVCVYVVYSQWLTSTLCAVNVQGLCLTWSTSSLSTSVFNVHAAFRRGQFWCWNRSCNRSMSTVSAVSVHVAVQRNVYLGSRIIQVLCVRCLLSMSSVHVYLGSRIIQGLCLWCLLPVSDFHVDVHRGRPVDEGGVGHVGLYVVYCQCPGSMYTGSTITV